jgi:hypothetical protein
MRTVLATTVVLVAVLAGAQRPLVAKVTTISLADLAQQAEFIGIVRVDRISLGIPLLRRPRATATVLEGWKGRVTGRVSFAAAPTWICDISDAKRNEEAVVFVRDGRLLHAGRGRMPVFTREGRRLAAFWDEVTLPKDVFTEEGPEPELQFIRAVSVDGLRSAIAIMSDASSCRPLTGCARRFEGNQP